MGLPQVTYASEVIHSLDLTVGSVLTADDFHLVI